MKLTRGEFERRWADGTLNISLVGMSNIGKSWLALRLGAELKCEAVEVDHFIRERLSHDSMADFAQWLGHPNTAGYAERERESLALEDEATLAALDALSPPAFLDTTGSVIYCERACKRLKAETFVVYLQASSEQRNMLEDLYFTHPKPLNWSGHFNQETDELFGDAVKRSYPRLLASRDADYISLADHVVPADAIYETSDDSDLFALLHPTGK